MINNHVQQFEGRLTVTLEELEELIDKAVAVSDYNISVKRNTGRSWDLYVGGAATYNIPTDEMLSRLRQLATPPEPLTIEITVPFSWAMDRATVGSSMNVSSGDLVNQSCRAAVKPWLKK